MDQDAYTLAPKDERPQWSSSSKRWLHVAAREPDLRSSTRSPLPFTEVTRRDFLDFYAAVRSAYYQNRGVELNRGRPLPATKADDIFDETFDETFDE